MTQTQNLVLPPASFVHPQANRKLHLESVHIDYLFERARRRSIGFMVGPEGLVVRAPRWTPLGEVDAALREKSDWIVRKLHETRERQQRQESAQIAWADGVIFPYLGGDVRLQLCPEHAFEGAGAALAHEVDGGVVASVLRLALTRQAAPEQIRDAVQAWLMRQAHAHFVARLDHFAPGLQVRWTKLSLSTAGTRWGSARADGAIRLNWRLVHYRADIIDYVVVHELSHLRVMDHSPRFWDTVGTVVPDYKRLRRQLKDDAVPKW